MTRLALPDLTLWMTAAAVQHPNDLPDYVVERTGVRRPTVLKALRRLVEAQWLVQEGTSRRPTFKPGLLRQVVRRYALVGLSEDLPWTRDFAPNLALPQSVCRMVQHAFQELMNNAIDHSRGSSVTVSVRQTPSHVQLLVSDDGRGLFDNVRESFAIDDPSYAMLELSKGKLTSQPNRHTGRGLFFTSQLADVFDVHANGASFQRRGWDSTGWRSGKPLPRQGTSIYLSISLDTTRTLESVLSSWSSDGAGIAFDRTAIALRLLANATTMLDSRAQARRVVARLQQFRHAILDFDGINEIGHSFADELFRVFMREHPDVQIEPTNMTPRVAELVSAVRADPPPTADEAPATPAVAPSLRVLNC